MSQQRDLTPRELHAKTLFFPKLMDEPSAEDLVRRISSIGDRFGFVGDQGSDERRKHKYDIWIANQVRRELMTSPPPEKSIMQMEDELFRILDWAIETRPNLTSLTFQEAFEQQARWLERLSYQGVVRPQPIDLERVIYKCSNGCFFYILAPSDLRFEGSVMGHCVGGMNYKSRITNQRSIIISLRDEKNMPHVTIEVSLHKGVDGKMKGVVAQQQGKGNRAPSKKYVTALREFVLFSNSALTKDDAEFLMQEV